MAPDYLQDVRKLTSSLVEARRALHRLPELAFEEHKTAEMVAAKLREIGLAPRVGVGGTGVVATIDSGSMGPTVLVRSELDALPIVEENDVTYRSTTHGKMHACGHDGNTAILLTAATIWQRRRDELKGRIVVVFQPAEEAGLGAQRMLEDNALGTATIDTVVGLHLSSNHPTGVVGVHKGVYTCSTDVFRIRVGGISGHGGNPSAAVDPIMVAAQITLSLLGLVPNEVSPMDRAVVGVTTISGGSAPNVIPDTAELTGTVRTFDAGTRAKLTRRVEEIADGISRTFGATGATNWEASTPVLENTPSEVDRLIACAKRIEGVSDVVAKSPTMGGEDFGHWASRADRACYFFIGSSGGKASGWPHHHNKFDIDEAALPIAVNVLTSYVADILRE